MISKRIKGFTLVELIVVITILAILSAIGFVTYSGYLSGVRDVNRTTQIKAISNSLQIYSSYNKLPLPDNSINILHSGSIVSYQGVLSENIIEAIGYTEDGIDPKEKTYFNYYITLNRKKFELMGFLEDEDTILSLHNNKAIAFVDYYNKIPYVEGDKLGILIGDINTVDRNKPINEIITTELDLKTTTDSYTALLSNKYILTGTGLILKDLKDVLLLGGRGYTVDVNGNLVFTNLDEL